MKVKLLTYTNEFIETIILQLNSINNYYTAGDDDILFIKIGSTKVVLLDYYTLASEEGLTVLYDIWYNII